MKLLLLLPLALGATLALQEGSQPPALPGPTEQHEWLQKLVGEWSVTAHATMEPGGEPHEMKGTETVRAIGDLWILVDTQADMGGIPVQSVLTLGYDPAKEAFVGTWIDSIQTHMWHYVGHLEEDGRVLVLDTEGPSFADPSETAKYRERIEIVDEDRRTFSSSVRGEDGEWTTFMRSEARRVD